MDYFIRYIKFNKMYIMNLPFDLFLKIAEYITKSKMKLLDWIPLDKINWSNLSRNPNAIHLLEQNIDKIDWYNLSENPNAIHLLEQNMDKIDWTWFFTNPSIFEIDKKQLKINADVKAQIIDKIIHQ